MGKKRIIKKTNQDTGSQEGAREQRSVRYADKVARGIAHIKATYNNMKITITDDKGNVIAWSSSGTLGFRGAKKSTPFAAARVAEDVVSRASRTGIKDVAVMVRGVGSGRDSAIRALANQGLTILYIRDVTPLPHNGPRPRKVRRV